ncbi:hypothetical protein OIV83_001819 [Microbotryomycetes sp. JL201]|nr:hypothetical protein OIV83_001819 [Microbotryomycetes sp. JL201]
MATPIAKLGLSADYDPVLLVAASSGLLVLWQSMNVSTHRKRAGVKYPTVYASDELAEKSLDAKKFNCAQRAHGNTLENLPTFLFNLLFVGLTYPRAATALGATWLVGRVLYTIGYTSGVPAKRNSNGGMLHALAHVGLLGTSFYIAAKSVLARF